MNDRLPQNEKLLALGLEFPSRALAADTLDELYFILTNDLRSLVEFDRCFLLTHLGGESRFVAATHQPILDSSSKLQGVLDALAGHLVFIDKPLVLDSAVRFPTTGDDQSGEDAGEALRTYAKAAGWKYLCCIPLVYNGAVLGHLLMEFLDDNPPNKEAVITLVKIAPVFAGALAGRWLLERDPHSARLLDVHRQKDVRRRRFFTSYAPISGIAAILTAVVLFVIPMTFSVGGEAVVAPTEKQFAYCRLSGLIQTVYVRNGSHVRQGQELALLDHRELDYKIERERKQSEMLTKEIELLRSRAVEAPAMLAKIRLSELKKKGVDAELDYLLSQRGFLTITSPVGGVVVTKDVEALSGKKLEAGEPFCEIAELSRLCAEIYVPEDRVMRVKQGQEAHLYLNNDPRRGYPLKVDEIAPRSEAEPRLGNVYRVRAVFANTPASIKVGMKGIGSIDTGTTSLWTILSHRLRSRWNAVWLHFL